jgi:CHAP domain
MNVRLKALANAQAQIGVTEVPVGSNRGPKITAWLKKAGVNQPAPWCAAFQYSMFLAAGSSAVTKIKYPAAVYYWDKAAGENAWRVKRPFKGDCVAFSWSGPNPDPSDHIGIVERVLALPWPRNRGRFWLRTVEGNTGDAVRRRWRWVNPADVAFIRIPR